MPLGLFTTLSRSLSLESQHFLSNRFMVAMNFWLFVLNYSQIRIALAFMHYSATLPTIFRLVRKSVSACLAMTAGMVTEREKSGGLIEFVFSRF